MQPVTPSEPKDVSEQTIVSTLAALSQEEPSFQIQEAGTPKGTSTFPEEAPSPPFYSLQDDEQQDLAAVNPPPGHSAPFAFPFQPSGQMPTLVEPSVKQESGSPLSPAAPPKDHVPRHRFLPLLLIVGVVVITVIGGSLLVFAQSAPPPVAQRQPASTVVPTPPKAVPTVPPGAKKTAPAVPTVAATPKPPRMPAAPTGSRLRDDFHRPDHTGGWGMASGGQAWQVQGTQNQQAFSVRGGVGRITALQPTTALYTATLGPLLVEPVIKVQATFRMQRFAAQSNMGVVLRYHDAANYYKAYLSGTELILMKNVGGHQTVLRRLRLLAAPGTSYTLRVGADQNLLMAKAWAAGKPEPGWMISSVDTT